MRTFTFLCDHCLCTRYGFVIDTHYVSSKLFQRLVKCHFCGQITIESKELPIEEIKTFTIGCYSRWVIRQSKGYV